LPQHSIEDWNAESAVTAQVHERGFFTTALELSASPNQSWVPPSRAKFIQVTETIARQDHSGLIRDHQPSVNGIYKKNTCLQGCYINMTAALGCGSVIPIWTRAKMGDLSDKGREIFILRD
jgi:hypothetical protein